MCIANGGASFIRRLPNLPENSSAKPYLLKPSAANERTVDKLFDEREALGGKASDRCSLILTAAATNRSAAMAGCRTASTKYIIVGGK
jgi:hypothetical protein